MDRKKLKFMKVNAGDILSREDMRNVMAGSGGGTGNCDIKCENCYNSSCQGTYQGSMSDCVSLLYQVCGPGSVDIHGSGDGPAGTCRNCTY